MSGFEAPQRCRGVKSDARKAAKEEGKTEEGKTEDRRQKTEDRRQKTEDWSKKRHASPEGSSLVLERSGLLSEVQASLENPYL